MGVTNYDNIDATTANAKYVATTLPATPMAFYGHTAGQDVGISTWQGGELVYKASDGKLYVQTATSGSGAGTWRKTNDAFVTTTTSSTSSSTSSTTSTTSSSTSTSTSTSSSSSTSTTSTSTTTP